MDKHKLPRKHSNVYWIVLSILAVVLVYLTVQTGGAEETSDSLRRQSIKLASVKDEREDVEVDKPHPIKVELYVMSRCPDAMRCEATFDEVLDHVHSIASVQTHYIGTLNNGTVKCMHGPLECTGNVQQLCMFHHIPPAHNYDWFWKSLMCQNLGSVGDWASLQKCLDGAAVDAAVQEKIHACVDGEEGQGLLLQNVEETVAKGVKHSCTVYIDKQYRCTADGGTWYDCPGGFAVDDFKHTICDAYHNHTGAVPPVCQPA